MKRAANLRVHPVATRLPASRVGLLGLVCVPAVVLVLGTLAGDDEVSSPAAAGPAAAAGGAAGPVAAVGQLSAPREAAANRAVAVPGSPSIDGVRRGRVVDVHGRGLAGVVVGSSPAAIGSAVTATSGDDGGFWLATAAAPNVVVVDAHWETVQAVHDRAGGDVTFVVAERIELRGAVVDAAGQPIGGALLAVVPEPAIEGAGMARRWLTFSADDGSFRFPAVPALPSARLLTQQPGMRRDDRELPLRAPRGVVVQLHAAAADEPVLGTVFGPDGMPSGGATVRFGGAATLTDHDGAFRIVPPPALPSGTPLLVFAVGCTPVQLADPRPADGGAPAPCTVLLRPAVAIHGRIVDATGVPLPDWIVTLADPTPMHAGADAASVEGRLGSLRAVTDAAGAFRFANVFDRGYTIEAWAFRGGGVLRATASPASGEVTLTAAPQPAGARRGVVLDEDGRAVAGVVVGEARPGCDQVHRHGMRFDERATTDAAGRFTLARAGAALHLLVDGESIVPVRLALPLGPAREEELTVRVQRRRVVQFAGGAPAAVTVGSVGVDGVEQAARGDPTRQLGIAASAAELVVRRHGVAVGRLPLAADGRGLDLCVHVAAVPPGQ